MKKWSAKNGEGILHYTLNLLALWPWMSWLLEVWEINVCCLSHSVYGVTWAVRTVRHSKITAMWVCAEENSSWSDCGAESSRGESVENGEARTRESTSWKSTTLNKQEGVQHLSEDIASCIVTVIIMTCSLIILGIRAGLNTLSPNLVLPLNAHSFFFLIIDLLFFLSWLIHGLSEISSICNRRVSIST